MTKESIVTALHEAMQVSAPATAPVPPDSDVALVNRTTQATVPAGELTALVAALRSSPMFAELDGKLLRTSSGGAMGVNIQSVAVHLVARSLATSDPDRAVDDIMHLIAANSAKSILVMSLMGVDTQARVELLDGISLVPLSDLPPSHARGIALGQPGLFISPSPFSRPAKCALVLEVVVSPLLVPQAQGAVASDASSHLALVQKMQEICNCFVLIDGATSASAHMMWEQLVDPGATFGTGSMWQTFDTGRYLEVPKPIDGPNLAEVCQSYFAVTSKLREKALHVPIDRLNRASRQKVAVDKAIDLGLALEALLLHDFSEPTEVSYRFRLRGTWLKGGDKTQRSNTYALLKDLYALRSRAVHRGYIEPSSDVTSLLDRGLKECAALVRELIKRKVEVDWHSFELGQ